MKKSSIAAIATVLMTQVTFAQEVKINDILLVPDRGPYITNSAGSNWFVGGGVGINSSFSKQIKMFSEFKLKNNFTADVFVGKWFTPSIGLRVGYRGVTNNVGYDTDKFYSKSYKNGKQLRFGYLHGDVMWNVTNNLGGYKEDRIYNFIPYLSGGLGGINNGHTDLKVAFSMGFYNTFRINKVVNLFADLSIIATENPTKLKQKGDKKSVINKKTGIIYRPLYMPSLTVGATFKLGKKKDFDRASGVTRDEQALRDEELNNLRARVADLENKNKDLENKNAEATALNDALANKNNALSKENDSLKNENAAIIRLINLPDELAEQSEAPASTYALNTIIPFTVYFSINKSIINDTEKAHMEQWLKLQNEQTRLLPVIVTGGADSSTGKIQYNTNLAKKRAEAVREILIEHGFKDVSIKTAVDDRLGPNAARNRAALIEQGN